MTFVLDASLTMAWILPDEGTVAITSLFSRLMRDGAAVPGLWHLEIANILVIAERRGRITAAFRRAALVDLAALPIVPDPDMTSHAWHDTIDLAVLHRLTVYDAAYLELALRLAVPLATLDTDLIRAAQAANVALVETAV